MRFIILVFNFVLLCINANGQGCCSGGSGSPIAGGGSQGVLGEGQMEIAVNHQYFYGNRFKAGNTYTTSLFHDFHSNYIYSKLGYGLTKSLTISVEAGYFIDKTQVELFDSVLNEYPIKHHSGISDLIIFPRYDVLNKKTDDKVLELTFGMGYKIPIGKHNDSSLVYTNPFNGKETFATSPPLIQPTNGSQDLIFYTFFLRGFPKKSFRLFANAIYIRKGWNSLGEKFGDYASAGIFVGKTFFEKMGVTLELKAENIAKLQAADNVDLIASYGVDSKSTGSKKISFLPQISYSFKQFTLFTLAEIPLYEHVNGIQIASNFQITSGLAYRFFIKTPICEIPKDGTFLYVCPMGCKDSGSNTPGRCKECGMKLVKVK